MRKIGKAHFTPLRPEGEVLQNERNRQSMDGAYRRGATGDARVRQRAERRPLGKEKGLRGNGDQLKNTYYQPHHITGGAGR